MMTQTIAIFVDAYRELNARKMFWITLILSGVFILGLALFSADGDRMKFLHWSWSQPQAASWYKVVLIDTILVSVWLSWAAIILAIISTAGIFPDFISGGSIDLFLAKPVGRLRLFITKYMSALLFVILQASIFAVCAFLVVGIRVGEWRWGLFLTIPLLTLMFSYLYSVCVLIGVMTRSAIAALMLTLLFWFGVWGLHTAEQTLNIFKSRSEFLADVHTIRAKRLTEEAARPSTRPADPSTNPVTSASSDVASAETSASAPTSQPKPGRRGMPPAGPDDSNAGTPAERLARANERADSERATAATLVKWHNVAYLLKSIGPKTSETVGMMERSLYTLEELRRAEESESQALMTREVAASDVVTDFERDMLGQVEGARAVQKARRERTAGWVIGTSLLFEGVVLGIAAWIFCRRDY